MDLAQSSPVTTSSKYQKKEILFNIFISIFIGVQAYLALKHGLPGHLSVDSLIQLYEGFSGESISFNPPFMSLMLGLFGKVGSPPVIFILLMQSFYSLSIWIVYRKTKNPWLFALALIPLSNPIISMYTGIVWKDVLLAHSAGLIFIYLTMLHKLQLNITLLRLTGIFVLMVIIMGSRQQGVLFVVVAAGILAAIYPAKRYIKPIIFLSLVSAVAFTTSTINNILEQPYAVRDNNTGLMIAIRYDLAGINSNGGDLKQAIDEPLMVTELYQDVKHYTSYRVDTLLSPTPLYWKLTNSEAISIWVKAIGYNPSSYFQHRLQHYSNIMGLNKRELCSPMYTGISNFKHPRVTTRISTLLGYAGKESPYGHEIRKLTNKILNTPIYGHWFYAVLLILASLYLWYKKDYVPLVWSLGILAFSASFSVLSIACDFRYIYSLTVSSCLIFSYCILSFSRSKE